MARASSIYVAFNSFGEIKGLFTVKHELTTWLRKYADEENWQEKWVIIRYRDGQYYFRNGIQDRNIMDMRKLLADE